MKLAEGPCVARENKNLEKNFKFLKPTASPAIPECPQKISAQSFELFGWLDVRYIFTNVLFYFIYIFD